MNESVYSNKSPLIAAVKKDWKWSIKWLQRWINNSCITIGQRFLPMGTDFVAEVVKNFTAKVHTNVNSRFPSLGIPRLELENLCWNTYVGHWNSYVGIPMSNVGIPTLDFSFMPRFLSNLMIFIIWMNLSSFTGTIYIEKSSNLAKIWAEMRKPTLEFLRWTLEFRRRNSNVQHRYSNVGIPSPT